MNIPNINKCNCNNINCINNCNKCNILVKNNCKYIDCGTSNCSFNFTINNLNYVFKINNKYNEDNIYIIYEKILKKHILFDNLIYYKSKNKNIKILDNINNNNNDINIFNDIINNIDNEFIIDDYKIIN